MSSGHDLEKHGEAAHLTGYAPRPASRIANPAALGLFSFASTTLILSLFNLQTRSIGAPNAVVGMAVFCGGLAQLLAGMWEFPKGNMFGATAFSSYGAFWMSYATILIPGSGILAAYEGKDDELASALGIYLVTWTLVTFFLLIAALRKNVGFIVLLALLTITFALLAAGMLAASTSCSKAGGGTGVVTAFVAYYCGLSDLLASEELAVVNFPLGHFRKND